MLLFAAAALANTQTHGWPCSRMNWAWRNVWSTCSINSYVPTDTAGQDHAPSHFRKAPILVANGPTNILTATGEVSAVTTGTTGIHLAEVPNMFCNNLRNTGGVGTTAAYSLLRSRCRRAIDAYGGIVRACQLPPVQHSWRGPIASSVLPDFAPVASHQPHSVNVNVLGLLSHRCSATLQPGTWRSPSTTCPGLLGWWTVVWTACGFRTYGPNFATSPNEAEVGPRLAPLGGDLSNALFWSANTAPLGAAPGDASAPAFMFCSPNEDGAPRSWNRRGPSFRTSRCRRALDQFGRTARRCGGIDNGVAPAWGNADPLRRLLVPGASGGVAAGSPHTLGMLAPLCN